MYDVIIIGGGPAGLTAAIYAARAKMHALLLEKDSTGMGAVSVSERVENYPGLPGIGGFALTEKFRTHAEQLGAEIVIDEMTAIARHTANYTVSTRYHGELAAQAVIYAAGTAHRRLEVPGAEKLGVSYCAVCDGAFYPDAAVAVIGGGDSALEDALYLSDIAKQVYLIHRRSEFRAAPVTLEQVRAKENIRCILSAEVTEITGSQRADGILLRHTDGSASERLAIDAAFIAIGGIPDTERLQGICQSDADGYLIAGEDCVTSAPGFFAAGDVRTKPLRQIVTAAADGANAVQSAANYLRNMNFS